MNPCCVHGATPRTESQQCYTVPREKMQRSWRPREAGIIVGTYGGKFQLVFDNGLASCNTDMAVLVSFDSSALVDLTSVARAAQAHEI